MTQTVTLTMDGKTQAIRLPMEFRFDCQEVYIEKQGDAVILRPKPENLATRWRRFSRPLRHSRKISSPSVEITPTGQGVVPRCGCLIPSATGISSKALH